MNRKQITKDLDKIWTEHVNHAIFKDTRQKTFTKKVADYILKVPCCGHSCCCNREGGKR